MHFDDSVLFEVIADFCAFSYLCMYFSLLCVYVCVFDMTVV